MVEGEEEAPRPRPPLAVEALRGTIVNAVQENRVTLIVGETGCGKSSMIPQFLIEENLEPVMCTQPRRFAVVALAQMVAKSRKWELGEEVGYHIGHSNVLNLNSTRSKIVFKTAGVVLEQMRHNDIAAFQYKVIILDEIHERSVESDLLLAYVREFMMESNDLRLVLMSATVDSTPYESYFQNIGKVKLINIPSSPLTNTFQSKVQYLEQIDDILKMNSEPLSMKYCSAMDPNADADLKSDVYDLIKKLVLHINQSEPDIEKSILVFLPTNYALERQSDLLSGSTVKVILATNIAESSVTIPGVAYVIDSCRSLQIYWDAVRKTDSAKLEWISKSQAEQRKGRTGRTCDGQIYCLVTVPIYNNFRDHEYPSILKLSLREQVLMICCSESSTTNNPTVLLKKLLNPPESAVIQDALDSLVQIKAVSPTSPSPIEWHGRNFYGCLLNSLPLSFRASVLALKFGEVRYLHEGVLISIMLDIQPLPILQPFGCQTLRKTIRDNYFDESAVQEIGKTEARVIANLRAFQFWQCIFKDKYRLEYLKNVGNNKKPEASVFISTAEQEWCASHYLLPRALHNISEKYDDIMRTLHCFRSSFLLKIKPPMYLQTSEFHQACRYPELLKPEDMNSLSLKDDHSQRCTETPYVSATYFGATNIVNTLKTLIKEMKIQLAEEQVSGYAQPPLESEKCLCIIEYLDGSTGVEQICPLHNSFNVPKPACKFFLTLQGCRNGNSCSFRHDRGSLTSSSVTLGISQESTPSRSNVCWEKLRPASGDGHILVVNDKNLKFCCQLRRYHDTSKIVVCTPGLHSAVPSSVADNLKILENVADPSDLIIGGEHKLPVPWTQLRRFILLDGNDSGEAIDNRVLQKFFEHIAIKILSETLTDLQVILIMNNKKFVQIQVEKLARECFFFLGESFIFKGGGVGWFQGIPYANGQVSGPVAYLFNMHHPTGVRPGDFAREQN